MEGSVLGIAPIMVMPPDRAAAVQDAKSSLWVWPGSLTCTWVSIKPGRRMVECDVMQSTYVFILGALMPILLKA